MQRKRNLFFSHPTLNHAVLMVALPLCKTANNQTIKPCHYPHHDQFHKGRELKHVRESSSLLPFMKEAITYCYDIGTEKLTSGKWYCALRDSCRERERLEKYQYDPIDISWSQISYLAHLSHFGWNNGDDTCSSSYGMNVPCFWDLQGLSDQLNPSDQGGVLLVKNTPKSIPTVMKSE